MAVDAGVTAVVVFIAVVGVVPLAAAGDWVMVVVVVAGLLVNVLVAGTVCVVFLSAQPAENNVDSMKMLSRMENAGFVKRIIFFYYSDVI